MLGLHLARSGVEELRPAGQILNAGMRQLETHHARKHAADDAGHDREDQVEGADVLVVRRHEPADEKARRVVIMVVMRVIGRSEERRVGKECGSRWSYRWSRDH